MSIHGAIVRLGMLLTVTWALGMSVLHVRAGEVLIIENFALWGASLFLLWILCRRHLDELGYGAAFPDHPILSLGLFAAAVQRLWPAVGNSPSGLLFGCLVSGIGLMTYYSIANYVVRNRKKRAAAD